MAHTTIGRRTAARGRRVLAAIVLIAVLAAGAAARSRNRESSSEDPAPVTTTEARALLASDGAWQRIAGAPPMSALRYPHSR
jgi:hypothetical protein